MGMRDWHSVTTYQQLVTWRLQTMEEISIENAGFFKYLIEQVGSEIAMPWITGYLESASSEIEDLGAEGP